MHTATKNCLCDLHKDSSSKNDFQSAHSLTIWQRYGELKPYQEFEAFYGNRLTRVRVVSRPQIEGDRIRVLIAPCKTRVGKSNSIPARFDTKAWVEVFIDRTPPPDSIDAKELRSLVRDALTPSLQSKRQMRDTIRRNTGRKISPVHLETILREIPEEWIRRRQIGAVMHYRLPLHFSVGMAVVENLGSFSQRYGWVEQLKVSRQHGIEFPVCRWIDGTQSFSSDDLLEQVTNARMLTRIEQAQQIRLGQPPPGFIEVPYFMLRQLQRNTTDRELLLHLAKQLNLIQYDQQELQGVYRTRKQIFDFLNIYYPEILETPYD